MGLCMMLYLLHIVLLYVYHLTFFFTTLVYVMHTVSCLMFIVHQATKYSERLDDRGATAYAKYSTHDHFPNTTLVSIKEFTVLEMIHQSSTCQQKY
jgi:hypothetical protein